MERGLSRLRAVVGVALGVAVVVGAAVAAGVLGAPSVADVQNRFAGVSDEETTIRTDVVVRNPNPIGVSLGGVTVNYTVDLGGVRLASGTKEGVDVTSGNSTLSFRTAMANERIPGWWVSHIRDGERSALAVHATVRSSTLGRSVSFDPVDREIETDLLSAFNSTETRPVNADQPLVSDPVLYVNETGASWGAVSEAETPIRMRFVVYNPKTAPYTVTGIGYEITMNDVAVGSGETDRAYAIPPRSTRTVRAVTAIDNQRLDEWWVTHIERDQVTDLRIDFYARIELPGGQEVRVPLDPLTYTETMETDVFGTKRSSPPPGDGSTATPADGGTPADDETTPTEAPTTTTEPPSSPEPTPTDSGTPTPTATPTPTPTDTGGGLLP